MICAVEDLIETRKLFGVGGRSVPKVGLLADLLFCKDYLEKLW